jgi:hypothetical protein
MLLKMFLPDSVVVNEGPASTDANKLPVDKPETFLCVGLPIISEPRPAVDVMITIFCEFCQFLA